MSNAVLETAASVVAMGIEARDTTLVGYDAINSEDWRKVSEEKREAVCEK